MHKRLKQVLHDKGVGVGFKGTRENRVRGHSLAAEMYLASEDEKPRVLTKSGAHLVLKATKGKRISYKEVGAALVAEAAKIVAEHDEMHARQLETFVKNTKQLADAAPDQPDGITPSDGSNGEESSGTAGN